MNLFTQIIIMPFISKVGKNRRKTNSQMTDEPDYNNPIDTNLRLNF